MLIITRVSRTKSIKDMNEQERKARVKELWRKVKSEVMLMKILRM
jgi:hypothetical protein